MASIKLQSRLKLLSPFVDEKVFRNLQKRLEGISLRPKTAKVLDHLKGTSELTEDKSVQVLKQTNGKYLQESKGKIKVNYDQWYKKDTAELKVEPIYKTLPNARVALNSTTPEPRFIWKEKNWPSGFPNSPEEANTNVMTYLEQKDCYQRLQKLNVKDFCVGSIVSVTRSDPYVPKGSVKFVGICIGKNHWQNTLGATFTLRNVVEGEPVEVNFQLYSPLIQKIEVLKHERRHRKALWYLRDYPPSFSSIDEKMKPRPYREEPSLYIPSKEEKQKIKKWFTAVWKQKRR